MPKISTNRIKIYHKDIEEHYDIGIMYNQTYHFYAILPEEFKDIIHHLDQKEIDELFIIKMGKRAYNLEKYTPIVQAETEKECFARIRKCLPLLMDKIIVKNNVIIVFYNPLKTTIYNNHGYNKEHAQIGLQFGLTYAVETTVGDKKVYSVYSDREAFGETRVDRHEIKLWNESATIIPDTKENREMLEQLYSNLKKLNNKMKEFTSTPKNMLDFISSNMKMLNA